MSLGRRGKGVEVRGPSKSTVEYAVKFPRNALSRLRAGLLACYLGLLWAHFASEISDYLTLTSACNEDEVGGVCFPTESGREVSHLSI
jgi:hypothetical protein